MRHTRRIAFVLVLATYVLVQWNGAVVIAPIYGIFQPRQLGFFEHLFAIFCTAIPVFILPRDQGPKSAATWILYLFMYLSTGIVGISVLPDWTEYAKCMSLLAAGMAVFALSASIKFTWNIGAIPNYHLDSALLVLGLFLGIYCWSLSDFSIRFGIDDVYDRRMLARDIGGWSGYFLAPFRLLFPIMAVYAWQINRRPMWLAILLVGCSAVFSYDGSKSILLFPVLLLIVIIGLRSNRLYLLLASTIAVTNILGLLLYYTLSSDLFSDYIVRRMFIIPGMLTSFYWDHASSVDNLSRVTYEIGLKYLQDETSNANSNFLMWGLAWAGIPGVLAIACLGGIAVSMFSQCPGKRFPYLGSLMACGCTFIWTEQFLHTSLLSSGVVFVMTIALLMRLRPSNFSGLMPRMRRGNLGMT